MSSAGHTATDKQLGITTTAYDSGELCAREAVTSRQPMYRPPFPYTPNSSNLRSSTQKNKFQQKSQDLCAALSKLHRGNYADMKSHKGCVVTCCKEHSAGS